MSISNLNLSQPQPYSAGVPGTVGSNPRMPNEHTTMDRAEDCRDFLRTGRCKYGASCKYYHPPNVQTGGGMKTPLNPTEPMFPVRPNEPICQYFMKHGTCKFGQACKFHHPPLSQQQAHFAAANAGPSPMLVGMGPGGGARKIAEPATQLVAVGPPGSDLSNMMVQFLPQRPEEPDCIYFLKNGRCKYGATCRYHHPIQSYQSHTQPTAQNRQPRHPRANDPYATSANAAPKRIHYTTQQPSRVVNAPPGHIVVASEGSPFSFVNIDQGGNQPTAYRPFTFVSGELLPGQQGQYFVPTAGGPAVFSGSTALTEQGSSASSIASSFDTASSSLELTGNDAATAALWSRARKNGSGGSLAAFAENNKPRVGPSGTIPSSASDGNIAMRSHSNSVGSAGEYYADNGVPSGGGQQRPPPGGWRTRSSSFDQTKNTGDSNQRSNVPGHQSQAGRPPMSARAGGRRRSTRGSDEGFTMMTSALLNMLDTQEETSAEAYSEDDGSYVTGTHTVPSNEDGSYIRYTGGHEGVPSELMEQLTLHPSHPAMVAHHMQDGEHMPSHHGAVGNHGSQQADSHWSPTWHVQDPHMLGAAPTHHNNNVRNPPPPYNATHETPPNDFGLYLP